MVAVQIEWVEDEKAQEALANLVRLLAHQAAREAHREAQDSRRLEVMKE